MKERFLIVDKAIRENGLENIEFSVIDSYDNFRPIGIKSKEGSNIVFKGYFEESEEESTLDIEDIDYIMVYSSKICYITDFSLSFPVNDIDAADEYLQDDVMLDYFDEGPLKDKLASIEWYMKSDYQGNVIVTSKEELTRDELDEVSRFISGQNSDGLGEGFSQQDFAEVDIYGEPQQSTFDWETNEYHLEPYREEVDRIILE